MMEIFEATYAKEHNARLKIQTWELKVCMSWMTTHVVLSEGLCEVLKLAKAMACELTTQPDTLMPLESLTAHHKRKLNLILPPVGTRNIHRRIYFLGFMLRFGNCVELCVHELDPSYAVLDVC